MEEVQEEVQEEETVGAATHKDAAAEAKEAAEAAVVLAARDVSALTVEATAAEAQALLLPGLYIIDANSLHGLSSAVKGPWTDLAETYYQVARRRGLHTKLAASPLRFARLCAFLRKLTPIGNLGGTLFAWRLSADEIQIATDEAPAEIYPAIELTPGVRRKQQRALEQILKALGVDAREVRASAERQQLPHRAAPRSGRSK